MPDNNQNNVTEWRNRLNNLEQLPPGVSFNKDEAWSKLYLKLEPSETRNHKALYWMAAAALVTGLLFSIIWFRDEKTDAMRLAKQQEPAIETVKELALEKAPDYNTQETMNGKVVLVETKKVKKAALVRPETNQPVTLPVQTDPSPAISTIQPIPQAIAEIEKSLDLPLLSLSTVVPAKKKVSVVYLNELETGNNDLITNHRKPKPQGKQYPNLGQAGPEDVFVASQPERFTISLSSAN